MFPNPILLPKISSFFFPFEEDKYLYCYLMKFLVTWDLQNTFLVWRLKYAKFTLNNFLNVKTYGTYLKITAYKTLSTSILCSVLFILPSHPCREVLHVSTLHISSHNENSWKVRIHLIRFQKQRWIFLSRFKTF